ncbi:MotE family protein [Litoreibacter albidus]|uniref:MotE family protein n=1 Tax=Litoreibacter albidus TaxID=670155 RepID=UPI003735F6F1
MASVKSSRSIKGVLTLIFVMLLASGSLRLGSIGIAVASSPADGDIFASDAEPAQCVTDAETAALMEMLKTRAAQQDEVEAKQSERQLVLEKMEADVMANLARVEDAEHRLAETINDVSSASLDDIGQLTSVYQSMKPKAAAQLFEQMSAEFAAGFLGEMPPASAAGILSALSAEKAYAVSVVLAGRNANAPSE